MVVYRKIKGRMLIYTNYSTVQKKLKGYKSHVNFNPLSANPTKWLNTLKQFVGFCIKLTL